jgi:hypothetical protein
MSFVDSAIDVDLTGTSNSSKPPGLSAHMVSLSDRLTHLADLAVDLAPRSCVSSQNHSVLHYHIDAIESLLDPRSELSREIARNRPQSPSSSAIAAARLPSQSETRFLEPTCQTVNHQLAALLNELSNASAQLHRRRIESRHIHDLFTLKCEGLAQRIIQLEDEVHEL